MSGAAVATEILKRVAETSLCGVGVTRMARALRRRRSVILAYHNVVPDDAIPFGDRSLHLAESDFAAQLDLIRRTHEIVPLDRILSPVRDPGRPRAAITFDDAYAGAVEIGVGELARRGLPATIFVVPSHIGGRPFWWDVIAGPDGQGLSPALRRFALDELRGEDDAVREWAREQGIRLHEPPEHSVASTLDELRRAASTSADLTFGAHTWSHPNLARVPAATAESELVRSAEWLRDRFDAERVVPWLSYPYGCHSTDVERAAARAGYDAAVRVDGGIVAPDASDHLRFRLPRLNVPAGVTVRGLELRMAGLVRR